MLNKTVIFLSIIIFSPFAFSGNGSGKVQIEHVYPPAKLFFYTTIHENPPACNSYSQASNGSKRWVIDLSTDLGKQQYSLLLAAQMANKDIKVSGLGTCNIHNNSEDIHWVGFKID